MTNNPTSTNQYISAARDNFEALKKLYASNDTATSPVSFWKLGNSFDTMIDFLDTIDDSSAHDVAQMAIKQLKASLKHIDGGFDGAWFDDFGWWSVATQRALQKPFFKQDATPIKGILSECWPRFTGNAPNVWQRHKPGTFEKYGPAVDGGVWNAYWKGTSNTYPGPKNGDPSNGNLIGIQNTVTNALYLMAAHRLGHTDPVARQAAEREFKFLLTWLDEKEYSLWRKLDTNAGLVRERVGYYANVSPAPGFQEEWAWTGDQGLILGDLSDAMLHLEPGFRGPLLARAKALLSGVRQRLVDNGVVQDYTSEGIVPDGDTADYQVGRGVFWRNALYVWKTNSDLQTFLKGLEYRAIVRASADAAAKAPTAGASFDMLTNHTAVLVAATAMLV